jgi:hypothetical protein
MHGKRRVTHGWRVGVPRSRSHLRRSAAQSQTGSPSRLLRARSRSFYGIASARVLQGALACAPQSDSIRKELIRRRKIGESIILDRLKRAKAEGDLPPDADPADLARYLSIVIYGITIQAAGGATRKELRGAAALALQVGRKGPTQKGDRTARFDQQAAVRIGPDSLPVDSAFQKTLLCILRSR